MNEVIFNTEAEAQAQQELDHQCNITCHASMGASQEWLDNVTEWAVPREREDGKWAYKICPHQDYTGMTVEAYQE